MRVLLFTDTLGDVNGVSRFIRDMAAEASAAGRDLRVVTSTRMAVPVAANVTNVPPLAACRMPRYPDLEVVLPPWRALRRLATASRPDVIHVSTPGPVGLAGRGIALRLGVPLVGTYHTDFPAYVERLADESAAKIAAGVVRWFYAPFARVLSRSAGFVDAVAAAGVAKERIAVLRPGVRTEVFSPARRDEAVGAAWGGAAVRVLYVGRVSVEKNMPLLAAAWRRADTALRAAGVAAHLVVVGDGPHRAAMAEALRGTRHVFTGFLHGEALAAAYATGDLFVFPSTTDTLGQVVLEAHASGLAAIVSGEGGPREVVEEGVTGVVVADASADAWSRAIERLVLDHAARRAMGVAASRAMQTRTIRGSFEDFWRLHAEVAAYSNAPP